MEETAAMLEQAASDGITAMVATPHFDFRYRFDPEHCRAQLDRIREECPRRPRLHLGCELHFTPENIAQVREAPAKFTLNGGDCVLVEFPDTTAGNFEPGLEALLNCGVRPVIAHPERTASILRRPEYAKRLVEMGCYLQLTARSLAGAFGPGPERMAAGLLKQKLVHFIASDSHGAERRRPILSRVYQEIVRRFDESTARLLLVENPRAALESAAVKAMTSRKVFFFARS
jgi:protein-tyrosine phosphatase